MLIVDVSRIRPDDLLTDDLGLGQIDGLDGEFLLLDIQKEFSISLRPEATDVKTVRDLIQYVSRHHRRVGCSSAPADTSNAPAV